MIWIGLPRPQGGAAGSIKSVQFLRIFPDKLSLCGIYAEKKVVDIAARLWYLAGEKDLQDHLFKGCWDANFFCQLETEIKTNCTKEANKKI